MRISCDLKDPGHRKNFYDFKVRLDGVVMRHCITADDDLGLVVRLKTNEHGYLVYDVHDQVVRETLRGTVKINRCVLP